MTHICVSKLVAIGSDNGLSPGRRQAIIRTNAGILLIGPLGTNFSEILIEIHTFSFKKMHLKMSSAKWRPFCIGLNVLIEWLLVEPYGGMGLNQHQVMAWTLMAQRHYLMMTSSNVNIFRVTGSLWGESTGDRWIPLPKAGDAELWCFLWSAAEEIVEQTIEVPGTWDAIALIMMSL